MSKTISICGVERGDVAYYLSVILSKSTNMGQTVLTIDNSYSHDIYNAVADDCTDKNFVIKQNITYMKNVLFNKDYEGTFDYVIIWHGMNIKEEILKNSDYVYILPNYTKTIIDGIKDKISDYSLVNKFAMRDSVLNNKFSLKGIAEKIGVAPERIEYELVFDIKDYETYLAFLYNGRQTFTNLTPVFNEFLVAITAQILEVDVKEATKIFKGARG